MKAGIDSKRLVILAAVVLFASCSTTGKVRMATAPVWFFKSYTDLTPTACVAVNLHDHAIELRTELVYHNDDTLPYPVSPETLHPLVGIHTVKPGEATVVKSNGTSEDNHLARCLFDYKGNPDKVKYESRFTASGY